jgi:small GTP-binding protein
MGNILSNYYQKIQLLFEKKANLLMLGLDSAGKTTLLYKLKLDKVLQTIPTVGFNVESVKYKSLNMTMWDIGGQEKIRPLWRHYYDNVDGVIFILDSNDCDRIEEVKTELHYIMSEDRLKNVKLLIFCNKQDLPNARSVDYIGEQLELNTIKQEWYIQECSALYGSGIFEGLEYIYKNI